jgi:hypothetical protein
VTVIVDAGVKCTFLKKIVRVGEKTTGWKPSEPGSKGSFGGGGGRRFSPEELLLKQDEGTRIARSVAIDRAISMVDKGIAIEKVADLALALEAYILKGELPRGAKAPEAEVPEKKGPVSPPSESRAKAAPSVKLHAEPAKKDAVPAARALPKRLAPQVVNSLFNEAMRGGVVADWQGYVALVQHALKVEGKTPYQVSAQDFQLVESLVRSKLGQSSAA